MYTKEYTLNDLSEKHNVYFLKKNIYGVYHHITSTTFLIEDNSIYSFESFIQIIIQYYFLCIRIFAKRISGYPEQKQRNKENERS